MHSLIFFIASVQDFICIPFCSKIPTSTTYDWWCWQSSSNSPTYPPHFFSSESHIASLTLHVVQRPSLERPHVCNLCGGQWLLRVHRQYICALLFIGSNLVVYIGVSMTVGNCFVLKGLSYGILVRPGYFHVSLIIISGDSLWCWILSFSELLRPLQYEHQNQCLVSCTWN